MSASSGAGSAAPAVGVMQPKAAGAAAMTSAASPTAQTSSASAGAAAPVAGAAAVSGVAGSSSQPTGIAGAAAGGAGTSAASDQIPPCPSGWTCQDPSKALADMGIADGMATDEAGKPIDFSCGNNANQTCDPKDPVGSCKELSKPFCAHIAISSLGVDLYSCAQHCKP